MEEISAIGGAGEIPKKTPTKSAKTKGTRSTKNASGSDSLTKTVYEQVKLGDVRFQIAAESMAVRFDDPVYQSHRNVWESLTRGKSEYTIIDDDDRVEEITEGIKSHAVISDVDAVGLDFASESGVSSVTTAPVHSSDLSSPAIASPPLSSPATGPKPALVVHRMCGMRKFGYFEDACYGYRDLATFAIGMEKENGENAQLAAFTHKGIRYWTIGSKNVPVCLRHDHFLEDLAMPMYVQKERYGFARRIARLFYDVYLSTASKATETEKGGAFNGSVVSKVMSEAGLARDFVPHATHIDCGASFHEFLSVSGYSVILEAIFLDSQHLVDYSATGDDLRAFAFAKPGKPSRDGLTAVSPIDALDVFTAFGVRHARIVGMAEMGTPAYETLCRDIEALTNSEGAVMYALGPRDEATGDRKVVFMYKWKSNDYVIGRRARQLILGGLPVAAIASRLRELVKLDVPADMIEDRLTYFLKFNTWLRSQEDYKTALVNGKGERQAVQAQWVTLNKRFAPLANTFDMLTGEVGDGGTRNNGKTVIMFQGLPLTGKSTLARQLYYLLQCAGHVPRWINSDEIPGASKRAAYLSAIADTLQASNVTHIILDKSNLDEGNVKDYLQLGVCPSVTIRMRHPGDAKGSLTKLLQVCRERFALRGDKHRTLRADEAAAKIEGILNSFASIDGAANICGGVAGHGAADSALVADDDDAESSLGLVISHNILMNPKDSLAHLWAVLASNGLVSEALTPLAAHQEELDKAIQMSKDYEALLAAKPAHTRFWGLVLDEFVRDSLIELIPKEGPSIDWEFEMLRSSKRKAKRSKQQADEAAQDAKRAAGAETTADAGSTPAVSATPEKKPADPVESTTPSTASGADMLLLCPHVHHTFVYFGNAVDPISELKFAGRVGEPYAITVRAIVWDDNAVAAVLEPTDSVNAVAHVTLALKKGIPAAYSNAMLHVWASAEGSPRLAPSSAQPNATLLQLAKISAQKSVSVPALTVTGRIARNPA